MAKVGIVVLCGLPGSGKSTLCHKLLRESQENIQCAHVDYDGLMPSNIEKELIETSAEGSLWKQYRGCIKNLVSRKISEKVAVNVCKEDVIEVPQELEKLFDEKCSIRRNGDRIILLIDDNMYYKSMRYQYFQLARQYHIGFGQIFVKCPLEKALDRNCNRTLDKMVAKEVIETMATKIEAQSSEEWEKQTLVVDEDYGNFHLIFQYFSSVILENPIKPVEDIDPEMQKSSRIACSESVLYQTDLILRKLVGQFMSSAKVNLDKTNLRKEGLRVNQIRSSILSEMKKQEIQIEEILADNSKDAALDNKSPLFQFVRQLLEERL